jgi:hypothetical protein
MKSKGDPTNQIGEMKSEVMVIMARYSRDSMLTHQTGSSVPLELTPNEFHEAKFFGGLHSQRGYDNIKRNNFSNFIIFWQFPSNAQ